MSLPKFNLIDCVHFITINTYRKEKLFKEDKYCQVIIDNLKFYRQKFDFKLSGYVIMPEHLHLLMQLSKEYNDISDVIRDIKSHSARQILYYQGRRGPLTSHSKTCPGQGTRATREEYPHRRMSDQRFHIWQPDFYDFNIYSEKKLTEKLNYIHNNPVRANLCYNPADWKYSSFRNYYLNDNSINEAIKWFKGYL